MLTLSSQGFASGDPDVDAWAIRYFASRPGMELGVAQSFSKNMGLYGERLGAFHLLLDDPALLSAAEINLVRVLRSSVSSCVSFAARAVALVLTEDDLRTQWRKDLLVVRDRIQSMRKALRSELEALGTPGTWEHITDQVPYSSSHGTTLRSVISSFVRANTSHLADRHVLVYRPHKEPIRNDG